MSRYIELTTTVTIGVDSSLRPELFREHVRSRIRAGFGDAIVNHPMAIRLVAVNDPDGDLHHPPFIDPLLSAFGQSAVVWSVGDVLDVRPDLSDDQAAEVLHQAIRQHDATLGIGWDTFEYYATTMFGEPPEEDSTTSSFPSEVKL